MAVVLQKNGRLFIDETAEVPAPVFNPFADRKAANPYVLIIGGPAVGHLHKITESKTLLGRSTDADIVIPDPGVSRLHATIKAVEEHWELVDLKSRNGTWLGRRRIERAVLEAGDRICLGSSSLLQFALQDPLEEQFQQQLVEASIRDGLTGAYNQRFFHEHLQTEFAFSQRHRVPLSLLLFDIDDFKSINDLHGHLAGDQTLRDLVRVVGRQLRAEDALARYGGDEFCATLRNTPASEARLVGERIRRVVAEFPFGGEGNSFRVRVSIGIATLSNREFDDYEQLISAADHALYADKPTS